MWSLMVISVQWVFSFRIPQAFRRFKRDITSLYVSCMFYVYVSVCMCMCVCYVCVVCACFFFFFFSVGMNEWMYVCLYVCLCVYVPVFYHSSAVLYSKGGLHQCVMENFDWAQCRLPELRYDDVSYSWYQQLTSAYAPQSLGRHSEEFSCMYVCTYVRMYMYMYVCMYVSKYVRMYVRMHELASINFGYRYIYTHMYTYIHTYQRVEELRRSRAVFGRFWSGC